MPKPPPTPPGPPTSPAHPFAIPAHYHPATEPPTCPGWYFVWCGPHADYRHYPGDWTGVTWWVELPRFVQGMLGQP